MYISSKYNKKDKGHKWCKDLDVKRLKDKVRIFKLKRLKNKMEIGHQNFEWPQIWKSKSRPPSCK